MEDGLEFDVSNITQCPYQRHVLVICPISNVRVRTVVQCNQDIQEDLK